MVWATATSSGTTAGLAINTYPASLALSYRTSVDGEGTECTPADGSGDDICIGGWYIPNQNELTITNNALCGGQYALTPDAGYWVSSQVNTADVRQITTNAATSCTLASGDGVANVAPSATGNLGRWVRRF